MENEKERKEQEENFREEMRNFFRRLQKAETVDECNRILKEYRVFKKKMHGEVPKLYDELKSERKRFFTAWLDQVEMLGGPEAPWE